MPFVIQTVKQQGWGLGRGLCPFPEKNNKAEAENNLTGSDCRPKTTSKTT